MIGNNSFTLNEATMKAAVQHYFDTVLFVDGKSPKIEGVTATSSTYAGASFTISVSDKVSA